MDVHVGELRSTVRAVDGESLLSPEVLDRIVRAVVARLAADRDRAQRSDAERELSQGRIADPWIEGRGAGG